MKPLSPIQQFLQMAGHSPDRPYLHQPIKRQWRTFTWEQVEDQARRIAAGLVAQGYNPGTRIGILSKNCAHWIIADLAIMMADMISVPFYFTAGRSTIEYVAAHSGMQALFLGQLNDPVLADQALPETVARIAFPYPTAPSSAQWENWLRQYAPLPDIRPPDPDDVMTIIYTSGSTGAPKGVVLSYRNLAAASSCSAALLQANPTDRTMSYLPLAHIVERSMVECMSFCSGHELFFVESPDTFIDDVKHGRPTCFLSVPRLWTKFQTRILAKMPDKKLQRLLKIPLVGRAVARKIRIALGLQHGRAFGVGTAPVLPAMLHWYDRIGIPISEAWGMTETAGLSCANLPFLRERIGTAGTPIDAIEMKLSADGEILVRGDVVFREYYRNPEATKRAFKDGWFHTGDLGAVDGQGVYRIVGRVKEQFKTAKGKYVVPVPIESLLGANQTIEQVCVMGAGRKQPIAVAVLTAEAAGQPEDLVRHDLETTLHKVNTQLESHQQLDHIVVSSEAWTIDNDLLTPTFKIKRPLLEKRYQDVANRRFGSTKRENRGHPHYDRRLKLLSLQLLD